MPRLTIFLISFGLSGLTGWATGWGLQMGYWWVTGAKFVTNQTNYITAVACTFLMYLYHSISIDLESSHSCNSSDCKAHIVQPTLANYTLISYGHNNRSIAEKCTFLESKNSNRGQPSDV